MGNSTLVKDQEGNYTQVVETDNNVRRTYTADTSIIGIIFRDAKGPLERIDLHNEDGTTKPFWVREDKERSNS